MSLVQPDPGLIIWTIVTFLVLLFILKKFAWKPILASLQKREDTISQALQRAEDAKLGAEKVLKENQEKLALAESQSQKIINDGKLMSEKLKNDMINETKAMSERMINQAKQEIQKSRDQAIYTLKSEISGLAIQIASKLISENLDEKIDRKAVDKFIDNLPNRMN